MMKRLVVDIHTHTISSGHAYGTIRENSLAAREKGLAGIGVQDILIQAFAALQKLHEQIGDK